MTWAKFDDGWPLHRKLRQAGLEAMGFDAAGICYCAREGTDGFIPDHDLPSVYPQAKNPRKLADRLVAVERWQRVEGGWLVHDYLRYNPPAVKAAAIKEARSRAGKAGAAATNAARAAANGAAYDAANGAPREPQQTERPVVPSPAVSGIYLSVSPPEGLFADDDELGKWRWEQAVEELAARLEAGQRKPLGPVGDEASWVLGAYERQVAKNTYPTPKVVPFVACGQNGCVNGMVEVDDIATECECNPRRRTA